MRDSLRAVLSLQSRKLGQPRFPSFFKTHIGAGELSQPVTLDDLYRETNDLFWKQTSYKVGQKLDPKNAEDAKMLATWSSIFTQVKNLRINTETNNLFWKQTNYKVGQKLDPKIAADKAKIPIWISINNAVKIKYENLPRDPVSPPTNVSQTTSNIATVHTAQADAHQTQADTHKTEAVQNAKAAVEAAASGDTVKAAAHTEASNAANEKADLHQQQADFNKEVVKRLADVKSLSELAYLTVKLWAKSPIMSAYFGWAIKEDGSVESKWTDTYDEITTWFDSLPSFGGYYNPGPRIIWGAYWEKGFTDNSGALIPVKEYRPSITQAQADVALNNATGKSSLKDATATTASISQPTASQAGGGGGAIAIAVALGGGLLMVAAKGKKR
jgi:hypothetical protein